MNPSPRKTVDSPQPALARIVQGKGSRAYAGTAGAHTGTAREMNPAEVLDATICSVSRATRCNPETDYHTLACNRRRSLVKDLLAWLGDATEETLRARLEAEIGELRPSQMYGLFMRWTREMAILQLQLTESETNMLNHRLVADLGDFTVALDRADAVRRFIVQEQLSDPKFWGLVGD